MLLKHIENIHIENLSFIYNAEFFDISLACLPLFAET